MTTVEGGVRPDQLDDRQQLHKLGYAQELYRSMGGFQNFAISFTIISILAGCLTSYYIAFNQGGPIAITWGWLLVGGFCIIVSLAMGEIASTYPTAGGLYYWASKLGSPAWGWFTGWFNLIGQISVTAAIGYGCAVFTTSLLNLLVDYPNTVRWVLFTYAVILGIAAVVNMFRVRITGALNAFSAWWHMLGVLVIVGVLIVVPDTHKSFGYVFGETLNNTGFSGSNLTSIIFIYVFVTGLLMAQYTITGFDASAHMSEETRQASRGAAWGMVMSVVVSVIFGFILLTAVTFALPNATNDDFVGAGQGILTFAWIEAMSEGWAEFILVIAVVAQMFCTIASTTSASRMMFAFSRDRAVPGHGLWRRVTKAERVPLYCVLAICVLAFLLMVPTLSNAFVGYAVGTQVSVIGLYIAFVLPIILRLRAGESFERGAWHLGKHYKWIDWLSIIWIAFICIAFMLPFAKVGIPGNEGFTWDFVNYTPILVLGALLLFGGWYVLSAHRWFKGPVRQGDEAELERIEAGYGEGAAPAAPSAGK
ncbi:MAG: amino acid permease [Actinobacteria bacterium]|nr:amino acid permease [Actinomycetota bacterium]